MKLEHVFQSACRNQYAGWYVKQIDLLISIKKQFWCPKKRQKIDELYVLLKKIALSSSHNTHVFNQVSCSFASIKGFDAWCHSINDVLREKYWRKKQYAFEAICSLVDYINNISQEAKTN